MVEARLMSNWDMMASLQFQLAIFMAKDKQEMKKMKFEHYHPMRNLKKEMPKIANKESWAMFKNIFDKRKQHGSRRH